MCTRQAYRSYQTKIVDAMQEASVLVAAMLSTLAYWLAVVVAWKILDLTETLLVSLVAVMEPAIVLVMVRESDCLMECM